AHKALAMRLDRADADAQAGSDLGIAASHGNFNQYLAFAGANGLFGRLAIDKMVQSGLGNFRSKEVLACGHFADAANKLCGAGAFGDETTSTGLDDAQTISLRAVHGDQDNSNFGILAPQHLSG